jgi:mersacidin/lichenicidin family type 2 lantibiotic
VHKPKKASPINQSKGSRANAQTKMHNSQNAFLISQSKGSQAKAQAQMHNPKNPIPISQSKSSQAKAQAQMHNPKNPSLISQSNLFITSGISEERRKIMSLIKNAKLLTLGLIVAAPTILLHGVAVAQRVPTRTAPSVEPDAQRVIDVWKNPELYESLLEERQTLIQEQRTQLPENPAGEIELFFTGEQNDQLLRKGCLTTTTNGVGCGGTPAFSKGVGCCILTIKAPPKAPNPQ